MSFIALYKLYIFSCNPNNEIQNAGGGAYLRLLEAAKVYFSHLSFFEDIKSWLSALK